MPYLEYVTKRFSHNSMDIINRAEDIISEYGDAGYDLTLRQLYYQFVARGFIPNKDSEYKKLGSIIGDARLAGLINWDSIVDRTRFVRTNPHWDSPKDIVEACATQFRLDTRSTQDNYMEVWIEKDALIGVIENICRKLDIPYFSCRGYVSLSTMWQAALHRIIPEGRKGKKTYILHLGDHDPSGIDMSRDIQDRMQLFGCAVKVIRLALNMNQVEELNPPPNPTKLSDSRCASYIAKYGNESWELDSLSPDYLVSLIREKVNDLTDQREWNRQKKAQELHRKTLRKLAKQCT
jgi:hypothetical protein